MTKLRLRRPCIAAFVLFGTLGASAPADDAGLMALEVLEKGVWELHTTTPGENTLNICLGDPRQLLQVRHPRNRCTVHVIENRPNHATVHYSCPGAGQGRTTVRIETSRLVQIHTQGIAQSAPFALAYEARRKGSCR